MAIGLDFVTPTEDEEDTKRLYEHRTTSAWQEFDAATRPMVQPLFTSALEQAARKEFDAATLPFVDEVRNRPPPPPPPSLMDQAKAEFDSITLPFVQQFGSAGDVGDDPNVISTPLPAMRQPSTQDRREAGLSAPAEWQGSVDTAAAMGRQDAETRAQEDDARTTRLTAGLSQSGDVPEDVARQQDELRPQQQTFGEVAGAVWEGTNPDAPSAFTYAGEQLGAAAGAMDAVPNTPQAFIGAARGAANTLRQMGSSADEARRMARQGDIPGTAGNIVAGAQAAMGSAGSMAHGAATELGVPEPIANVTGLAADIAMPATAMDRALGGVLSRGLPLTRELLKGVAIANGVDAETLLGYAVAKGHDVAGVVGDGLRGGATAVGRQFEEAGQSGIVPGGPQSTAAGPVPDTFLGAIRDSEARSQLLTAAGRDPFTPQATTDGQLAADRAIAAGSGALGAATADEDATWQERAGRGLVGGVVGSMLGAKGRQIGRIGQDAARGFEDAVGVAGRRGARLSPEDRARDAADSDANKRLLQAWLKLSSRNELPDAVDEVFFRQGEGQAGVERLRAFASERPDVQAVLGGVLDAAVAPASSARSADALGIIGDAIGVPAA
ncbi:MAG TPA: hypothetical protein VNM48_18085, partial [Chloroflexota bacterium]|nr:hypothetical protein [Chloroflexota bacterium]